MEKILFKLTLERFGSNYDHELLTAECYHQPGQQSQTRNNQEHQQQDLMLYLPNRR